MAPLDTIKALQGQRWRIAWDLFNSPNDVTSLANRLDLNRDQVSHHLKIMRDAGVVTYSKVGKDKVYRLKNTRAFMYFTESLKELSHD